LDNGATWAYSTSGITPNSWVRDIEVDSSGIVVAATTSGLYSSVDNGNSWQQATGAGIENDTITKIIFDYPFNSKNNTRLLAGSGSGRIYDAFDQSKYLVATMVMIFGNNEISGNVIYYLHQENKKMHGVTEFPKGTQPGNFNLSTDKGMTWQQHNDGLTGTSRPLSALAGTSNNKYVNFYSGYYKNMNGGSLMFKISIDWSTVITEIELNSDLYSANQLHQCYPNPCDHSVAIPFYLNDSESVSLNLYSVDGRPIEIILNRWLKKGDHIIKYKTENLVEGLYYYQLNAGKDRITRKMIVQH
jgi:hypothetical protein